MSEITCQGCRHYRQHPPDPANLGAPREGECRHSPPAVALLPSPQGLVRMAGYPVLPQNFPACDQFSPPETRAQADREELARLQANGEGDSFAAQGLRAMIAVRERCEAHKAA